MWKGFFGKSHPIPSSRDDAVVLVSAPLPVGSICGPRGNPCVGCAQRVDRHVDGRYISENLSGDDFALTVFDRVIMDPACFLSAEIA